MCPYFSFYSFSLLEIYKLNDEQSSSSDNVLYASQTYQFKNDMSAMRTIFYCCCLSCLKQSTSVSNYLTVFNSNINKYFIF